MNSVERVKAICKERKIPISKLERECGFSNGYIGQLRKGMFPADRLKAVSNYLGVSVDELLGENEQKEIAAVSDSDNELAEYLNSLKNDHDQRILFNLVNDATVDEVRATVAFLKTLRGINDDQA